MSDANHEVAEMSQWEEGRGFPTPFKHLSTLNFSYAQTVVSLAKNYFQDVPAKTNDIF